MFALIYLECVVVGPLHNDMDWSRWRCAVMHRVGPLELGEIAVAVAVSSAHRGPAFEAGQWIMDTIKQQTPIWKKEFSEDGSVWVSPRP